MSLHFDARGEPDLVVVWNWFEYQLALVSAARARALQLTVVATTADDLLPHERQLVGYSLSEIETFFDQQRGQLELLTMFELLATAEAILRLEVRVRVQARKKDALSRSFRLLVKSQKKLRLADDILTHFEMHGVPGSVVSPFRRILKLRHWLAHGRHWHPKLGRSYTPQDAFDIATALISAIPPLSRGR